MTVRTDRSSSQDKKLKKEARLELFAKLQCVHLYI
jgi:hypothetical protein